MGISFERYTAEDNGPVCISEALIRKHIVVRGPANFPVFSTQQAGILLAPLDLHVRHRICLAGVDLIRMVLRSITTVLYRMQVEGDPDAAEAKRKSVAYKDIEVLALSFCCISHIDHLHGLNSLQKLQLDNNRITVIQNLSHLVRPRA